MKEPASDVIVQRAAVAGGLNRMISLSFGVHALLVGAIVLMPASWRAGRSSSSQNDNAMYISLGGPVGPRAGGMTPMGGRPIQEVAPLARRPEPVRPPAAKAPEMVLPEKTTRPTRTPPRNTQQAPEQARGRTPTRGTEVRPGSAIAETGGTGFGAGLSMGGGGTGGYLDFGNFCCPEYLTTMLNLINRNWNPRQPVAGATRIKYTILRDGRIVDIEVEKSSGFAVLDLNAQRALLATRALPPLPSEFSEDRLTVHLNFQYQR
jgi:protein TonB